MVKKKTPVKKTTKKKVVRKKNSSKKSTKKKVTKKSSSRRKTKRTTKTSSFKHIFILFVLVSFIATFFYSLYLGQQVTVKFEGKRWSVPARVYGRPLELFAGSPVTPDQLKAELKRLGYQHQKKPEAEGTWGFNGQRYLINTRPFQFWDESVNAQSLSVLFDGQHITEIRDVNVGVEEALIRIEAPMIDSIYPSHNEDRILLKDSDLPELMIDALVAIEDRDFYQHYGVNPKSIFRALLVNLKAGHVVQGGSTLTQQLVKNFLLTNERSFVRKFNEALMALIVDARYEKSEILEAYANEIYLGQDGRRAIHGFGLASHFYFNRPLRELDLSKIALMVGLIKGPSYYDPRRHAERAKKRRNLVLDVMHEQGLISSVQQTKAKQAGLGVKNSKKGTSRGYPAFIKLVRKQLQRDYKEEDLTSEGLRVFTTLDPWIQSIAERQSRLALGKLEKKYHLAANKLETAVVIASPSSGEILALVGGRASRFSGFNRALDAVRPIGSLIKPFVYLSALMLPNRYSLVSKIQDEKVKITLPNGDTWSPGNYDKKSHGEVSLLTALVHSYNQATVNLGMDVGISSVVQVLRKAGVSRPVNAFPSMLLGALSLSPLEVTQMYQTLSAGGFYSPLRTIREVLDNNNQPLQRYPLTVKQALPASATYLTNTALQAVITSGTGRGLNSMLSPNYNLAGKTGTTNDLRDSWFAGFSSNYVATVWVGRDDNKAAGLTGSQGAMKIWGEIIKAIKPLPLMLYPSEDTEIVWIDQENGLLGSEKCESAVQIGFQKGYSPKEESDCINKNKSFFERLFD